MSERTIELYNKIFGSEPDIVVKGPGRINLMGEQTEAYNGFVLSAAINKAEFIALGKRDDREIHLFSEEYNTRIVENLDTIKPSKGWTAHILGVVDQFHKIGIIIDGFNIVIENNVPHNTGIASSTAIECAVAFALNGLFNVQLNRKKLAQLSQKAEQEFIGVHCGIMDQFSSLYSKKDHVIKLDCKTIDFTYYPLPMNQYKLVLLDTQIKHIRTVSENIIRKEQCEKGVKLIAKKYKSVRSLRDTTLTQIEECLLHNDPVYNRCKFVVEEIERLNLACIYLSTNDFVSFGRKMNASHEGLKKLYEVSCAELDFLVTNAQKTPGVLGSRMMGCGFGGATINLVENNAVDTLINQCTEAYKKEMKLDLKAYVVEIDDGTHLIF